MRVEKLHALSAAESAGVEIERTPLIYWGMDSGGPLGCRTHRIAYLKTLPDAPGVYRMLDAKGDVLYVGKAKSLKKRVSVLCQAGRPNERIARMIAETAEMLFVTTASETEALLLESNLIKRLKPRYNVSFRDDKSFPNILLREDHPFRSFSNIAAPNRQGRLFRAFRQRRRRQPHAQRPAARLPAALLLGFGVRIAHAALPACSRSSAAARPVWAASTKRAIKSWSRGGSVSERQEPRRAGGACGRHDGANRRRSISSAPRACATG
jgi:hypothetical protein